jgi:hypothetical protein
MNPHYQATMEAIDFQRDEMLLKELSMHISALTGTQDVAERKAILKQMDATAFHHTGALFHFHLLADNSPNAFILVPDSNSAAPMRPDVVKETLRKSGGICSEKEFFKGTVDLKKGRVSGVYSEIPMDIFFSVAFLKATPKGTYFAPEETSAVLIHEMGHGVMYLRYLGGNVLSNIVVAEVCKQIQGGADPIIVRDILKVAEQKTGYRIKDLGTIDKNPDPLLVQQVVMAEMIERIRSDLGTKYYDARAFEFVADQFAARHGGAAHIVKALDRMYRDCGYRPLEYNGRFAHFMLALVTNAKMIIGVVYMGYALGAVAALVTGGVTVVVGVAFATLVTILGGGDIYDDVPNRFMAMRRELIASTKDQNLTQQQRAKLIIDIGEIDKVMKNITEVKFGPGFFRDFMAGVFTGKTAQMKFMRTLEELANNRLFELSNQLQAQA